MKVTLEGGPIKVGDLLTTSSTPGHAMKANEPWRGGIIGTALEMWEPPSGGDSARDTSAPEGASHSGKIIALVHLNPAPAADPNVVRKLQGDVLDLRAEINDLRRLVTLGKGAGAAGAK